MKADNLRKFPNIVRCGRKLVASDSRFTLQAQFKGSFRVGHAMPGAWMEMILPQIGTGIVVCDAAGMLLLANAGAKKLAQQDPEGKPIDLVEDIWGELTDCDGLRIAVKEWPLTKALCGQSISSKECRLSQRNGSAFDILFSASPISDFARRIVGAVATLTDITDQKHQETLQHEQALERERSRLATHIHDSLSQSLTAITLQLQAAERDLHQNSNTTGIYLQRAITVARDTLADLRRCIWTLSHESLEGEDLGEALSFLAERLFTGTPVQLELSLQRETGTLPREMRHEILWISKEALANVLKHAQATKVQIELLCGNQEVQLRVHDNGHGFGPARSLGNGNGSFGLISMRKRAERLGGTVAVESQPGRGTRVVALIPRSPLGRTAGSRCSP
jgi:signal transduction histidine kinase